MDRYARNLLEERARLARQKHFRFIGPQNHLNMILILEHKNSIENYFNGQMPMVKFL